MLLENNKFIEAFEQVEGLENVQIFSEQVSVRSELFFRTSGKMFTKYYKNYTIPESRKSIIP